MNQIQEMNERKHKGNSSFSSRVMIIAVITGSGRLQNIFILHMIRTSVKILANKNGAIH